MSRRDGKEVYYKASDTEQIGLLHEIVEQVMEITCPEKEVDFQASQEEIIRNVHNYLIEHISERITIETLSREFLMNTTTLKTVFKKVYGTTIAAPHGACGGAAAENAERHCVRGAGRGV